VRQIYIKHSLLALVVSAATGSAWAQSSLTIFGILDASLTVGRGSGTGSSNKTQIANSEYGASQLGFRGTEDLGGGMSAGFWLEAGLNNDDGTGQASNSNNQASGTGAGGGILFNRRSFGSLAGSWGEVRLGRDYVPQFWNRATFDPYGNLGVGVNLMNALSISGNANTAVRASNSASYLTPTSRLGGFFGQVSYWLGENASGAANSKDGSGAGVRLGYSAGPLSVAGATGYTRYVAGGVRQSNLGGFYDFGIAKAMANYEKQTNGATEANGFVVGGLIPVSPGLIRVAYTQMKIAPPVGTERVSRKVALGYVYFFSPRTSVYGTYARVNNSGGAAAALGGSVTAPNSPSTGLDLGFRINF
jgi:predicted porin